MRVYCCMCVDGNHGDGADAAPHASATEVNDSQMSLLKGSQHPLAQGESDAGRMSADAKLKGMSIVFNRSAAQQADLEALLAAQQDPASPFYHQWLSPDQFAAQVWNGAVGHRQGAKLARSSRAFRSIQWRAAKT